MSELTPEVPDQSEQLDITDGDDTLVDRSTGDPLDEGYSPPENWSAAERFGNTAREEAEGETLDQRIAQEIPDVDPYAAAETDPDEQADATVDEVGDERAGRLTQSDPSGSADPAVDELLGDDAGSDIVASDVGIDGAAASGEEAAMHVIADDLSDDRD